MLRFLDILYSPRIAYIEWLLCFILGGCSGFRMTFTVYSSPVSNSYRPAHLTSRVLGLQASRSCLGVHCYFYRCVRSSQTEREQGKFYTRGLEDEREGEGGKCRLLFGLLSKPPTQTGTPGEGQRTDFRSKRLPHPRCPNASQLWFMFFRYECFNTLNFPHSLNLIN